jgi:hypothetical protein
MFFVGQRSCFLVLPLHRRVKGVAFQEFFIGPALNTNPEQAERVLSHNELIQRFC